MKKNFSIHFTNDSIILMRHIRGKRSKVGSVDLSKETFPEDIALLRQTMCQLSQNIPLTEVIIPREQILYTRMKIMGTTQKRQYEEICDALEGKTPYNTSDLIFDWVNSKGGSPFSFDLAIIAKSTYEEAEEFATRHHLNPLYYTAHPQEEQFNGTPLFDSSEFARRKFDPKEIVRGKSVQQSHPKKNGHVNYLLS